MEGVAVLVNAGILYAACGLTLYFLYFLIRLIYNYFKTKDKLSTKRSLKKAVIIIVIAVSLFYLIRLLSINLIIMLQRMWKYCPAILCSGQGFLQSKDRLSF